MDLAEKFLATESRLSAAGEALQVLFVTDVKIDDAIALWILTRVLVSRGKGKGETSAVSSHLHVFITGVKDQEGALLLARHCISEAIASASSDTDGAGEAQSLQAQFHVSERRAEGAARHEPLCYDAYTQDGGKFRGTSAEPVKVEPLEDACQFHLAFVLAQYFHHDLQFPQTATDSFTAESSVDMPGLWRLVPLEGGVCHIAAGFNTRMEVEGGGGAEAVRRVWRELSLRAASKGSAIFVLSNRGSFAVSEGGGESGKIALNDSTLASLQSANPAFWGHMVEGAIREKLLFACSQVAKALCGSLEPFDADETLRVEAGREAAELLCLPQEIVTALFPHPEAGAEGPPDVKGHRSSISSHVLDRSSSGHRAEEKGVLAAAQLLSDRAAVVLSKKGEAAKGKPYIERALDVFTDVLSEGKKEETSIEGTDGIQVAVVLSLLLPRLAGGSVSSLAENLAVRPLTVDELGVVCEQGETSEKDGPAPALVGPVGSLQIGDSLKVLCHLATC